MFIFAELVVGERGNGGRLEAAATIHIHRVTIRRSKPPSCTDMRPIDYHRDKFTGREHAGQRAENSTIYIHIYTSDMGSSNTCIAVTSP